MRRSPRFSLKEQEMPYYDTYLNFTKMTRYFIRCDGNQSKLTEESVDGLKVHYVPGACSQDHRKVPGVSLLKRTSASDISIRLVASARPLRLEGFERRMDRLTLRLLSPDARNLHLSRALSHDVRFRTRRQFGFYVRTFFLRGWFRGS